MSKLNFKRINEEQSEVWHEGVQPHAVATQAIFLLVKQLCSQTVADHFSRTYPEIGGTTTLDDPNIDSIASGLEVASKE